MKSSCLRAAVLALIFPLGLCTAWRCDAVELGGVNLGDQTQVDGHALTLNGAGIGMKAMLFKVYVIGLYLPARVRSMAEIVRAEGPRRISISMLRKVSADQFKDEVTSALSDDAGTPHEGFTEQMTRVSEAMSRSGRGLRRGDRLTLDWVPDKGTVIAINEEPVVPPVPGIDFYNALLDVWLGDRPTDASLKPKLLGQQEQSTATAP
jgi:hypothetical protein